MATVLHHSLPTLPAATALDGTENIIMTESGVTYKITLADFIIEVLDL
mgnify:CR=1 FL=1